MKRMKNGFLDLAAIAIEANQRPLGAAEIIHWARAKGKLLSKGKTPAKSLHASLSRSIKNDKFTPFVKSKDGAFGLRMGVRRR